MRHHSSKTSGRRERIDSAFVSVGEGMTPRFLRPPFLPEHNDIVLHTGFLSPNNAVMATPRGGSRIIYVLDDPTPEETAKRKRSLDAQLGEPFVEFAQPHKVYASPNGSKVRKDAVEMVWNDAAMMDRACGDGYYEKVMRTDVEVEILKLARELYQVVKG